MPDPTRPEPVSPKPMEAEGLRKLVRPPRLEGLRVPAKRTGRPKAEAAPNGSVYQGHHAEVFYFQKQMQMQTPVVVVLEGGARVEGVIEWYDEQAIKLRHGVRTLIYKRSIKYIYKAGEVPGSH